MNWDERSHLKRSLWSHDTRPFCVSSKRIGARRLVEPLVGSVLGSILPQGCRDDS